MSQGLYRVRSSAASFGARGWYGRPSTSRYHRPDCSGTFAGLVSPPLDRQAPSSAHVPRPEPKTMHTPLTDRLRRLATGLTPTLAVAFAIAFGMRW